MLSFNTNKPTYSKDSMLRTHIFSTRTNQLIAKTPCYEHIYFLSTQVVDRPAPARVSPLLTSRHLLQRRVMLPARKYRAGDDSPKVCLLFSESRLGLELNCKSLYFLLLKFFLHVCFRFHSSVMKRTPIHLGLMRFSLQGKTRELC